MQYLTMDGIEYKVRVVYKSMKRGFEIIEGQNAGTAINAHRIRDILGTGYSYELDIEPDPRFLSDYNAFYDAISAPVESHRIALPYGNNTLEFDAAIESGTDTFLGDFGGHTYWQGLSVVFNYIEPQRVPIDE